MIIERRQVHFYSFMVLAILLPLIFIAGLLFRPTYTAVDQAANPLFATAGFPTEAPAERQTIATDSLQGKGITLSAETFTNPQGNLILEVQPDRILQQPDLLVYWVLGNDPPEDLSPEAYLLGSLAGRSKRQFPLPSACKGEAGQLLVYSQGTQTLITALPFAADFTTDSAS